MTFDKSRLVLNGAIVFAFVSGWIGAVIAGAMLGKSELPPEFTLGIPLGTFLALIIVSVIVVIVVANRTLRS